MECQRPITLLLEDSREALPQAVATVALFGGGSLFHAARGRCKWLRSQYCGMKKTRDPLVTAAFRTAFRRTSWLSREMTCELRKLSRTASLEAGFCSGTLPGLGRGAIGLGLPRCEMPRIQACSRIRKNSDDQSDDPNSCESGYKRGKTPPRKPWSIGLDDSSSPSFSGTAASFVEPSVMVLDGSSSGIMNDPLLRSLSRRLRTVSEWSLAEWARTVASLLSSRCGTLPWRGTRRLGPFEN